MKDIISWKSILRNDRPLIFSILNCTPDSFSDGGLYLQPNDIIVKINDLKMYSDIVDVGAESTRPGAKEISSEEQIKRINPVYDYIETNKPDLLFSIDTRNSQVASKSLKCGFKIVNDVSGGNFDNNMLDIISSSNSLCVLMHMRGTPENMKTHSDYDDVLKEVCEELEEIVKNAISAGVDESKIMLDPGIGFAKTPEQCYELIINIDVIKKRLGLPLLVGHSRKSFIPKVISKFTNSDKMHDIDWSTAFISKYLLEAGVDALRVHDPKKTLNVIKK